MDKITKNIINLSKINRYLSLQFYVVWDIRNKKFLYNRSNPYGIFLSLEPIRKILDTGLYKEIEVDLSNKIPADFMRIIELGSETFLEEEKKQMIGMKFKQLVRVFIYDNKEFREKMNESFSNT
jgi:hypothetical protein